MNKGKVLIITGLLLIAAALCLSGYNLGSDYNAGKAADEAALKVQSMTGTDPVPAEGRLLSDDPADIEYPDYILNPDMEMPVKTVDGRDYIGTLSIPSLGILLPVQNEWNYPNLRVSPCRYSGTAYKGNFVICAHNYDRHFGQIKNLRYGDKISFLDLDGNRFSYIIEEVETLRPTAVEEMTSDEWDLTLFTCTLGGSTRIAVRCMKEGK